MVKKDVNNNVDLVEVDDSNTPIMAQILDEESITIDEIDEQALGALGLEFDADEGVILIDNEEVFSGLVDENGMFEIETIPRE